MPMPGIKCAKCTQNGIISWVLQGKNCPKCGLPCKNAHFFNLSYILKCVSAVTVIFSLLICSVYINIPFNLEFDSIRDTHITYDTVNNLSLLSDEENIEGESPILPFEINGSPLDQFIIRDIISVTIALLGNIRIALTNIGVYLLIAGWLSIAFNLIAINNKRIIINSWSLGLETIYSTVHSIVINQINNLKGQIYLPFIYTLFTYILVNNLIGMVPYSFAPTSHFILTFSLSFTIVLGATFLGFNKHGLKFFSLFVPSGCPLGLLPLLVLIEFISYLSRNVSLGLRLGANILSGHMLLNILSGFTYNIMSTRLIFFFLGLIPLSFIIAFSGLELGIAFIQAQVFVVLTCSYIKDALELH